MSSAAPMQPANADAAHATAQRAGQSAPQHGQVGANKGASDIAGRSRQATAQRRLQDEANRSQQSARLTSRQEAARDSARTLQLKAIGTRMNGPDLRETDPEEPRQAESVAHMAQRERAPEAAEAPKPNRTGVPDALKSGIESLSGMSLDHLQVHYNSSRPAQLNAYAFAQGSEIHVAPGQEQHLPHEAWHVVQQAQGRVQATTQAAGQAVNDDSGLEAEADAMGARGLAQGAALQKKGRETSVTSTSTRSVQLSAEHVERLAAIHHEVIQAVQHGSPAQRQAIEREAAIQLQSARFLLEDGEQALEGKVGKAAFLANMRSQVSVAAQRILGPFGMAQADCPDLAYWVAHYESKEASHIEQVIARYAPDTTAANNVADYLSLLVKRIEAGLVEHTQTGKVIDPEPMPDEIDRQRPPLSVFGIANDAMSLVQLKCASADGTDDRYALTQKELDFNAELNCARAKRAEERAPEIAEGERKLAEKEEAIRIKTGKKPENGVTGAVPYPYTLESARKRTLQQDSTVKTEKGKGEDNRGMVSFTTDLTMQHDVLFPTEAQVYFKTAVGAGMLIIDDAFSNKKMTSELKMADVLKLHILRAGTRPEDLDRVYIKNVVNEETVNYCLERFAGRDSIVDIKALRGVLDNTTFGGVLKNVVPHIIGTPTKITFDPVAGKHMNMTIE